MGWLDGFPFQSKEQRQRKEKEFNSRTLPFGEEGRQRALATLRQLCDKKLDDAELLWPYFTAKDAYEYNLADGEEAALLKAWHSINTTMRMKRPDRLMVLALVKLESGLVDLQHYPDAHMVRATALDVEEEV